MTDHEPLSAEPMVPADPDPWYVRIDDVPGGATTATTWAKAQGYLQESTATYWLATVRPNGTPHVMPVMAVWVDGRLFFSAGERTRKARNLARDSRCVVTVEEEPVDLVVEGDASIVRDDATLARVADAYASIYGWQVTVRQGAFHAAGGAPTAGPPPYDVYEVTPAVAFGLPVGEGLVPTRWRFREPSTGG
jgi:nitroimidazol reductase NimA-like FMN-containing flavoprotein (pyridoxamine 5'-phosphate oxidase superfamily)